MFIRSFFNPTPEAFELFGNSVAATGNNVIVAALRDDNPGHGAGAAYLFDGVTAEPLETFLNPESSVSDSYAWQVAALGESVLVGSPFESSNPDEMADDGVAYLYQPKRIK